MLTIRDLRVTIQSAEILRGVNIEVAPGEMIGLLGRNGAGKTTTLRAVMGLLAVRGGAIDWDGRTLLPLEPHRRAALGLGYMPEDRRLVPRLTVEENILVPLWAMHHVDPARVRLAYDLLPEVEAMKDRKGLLLSGGQQKLVALARAIVAGHRLLLLDEPFEGVAPALSHRLAEVIAALRGGSLSILLAQSDLNHSNALFDRTYVIERGATVTAEGSSFLQASARGAVIS